MLAPASAGLCSDSTRLFELVALVRGECAFFCPGGVPAVLEAGVLRGGSEFGVRRVRLACVRVCLCFPLLILYTSSCQKKRVDMVPELRCNSDNWPLSWSAFASVVVRN